MTDTANLGLPFIEGSQAQKHVTHNEALRILDAVIQVAVLDADRTAPPVSPDDGDRHIVAGAPTGVWTGHAAAIATWEDSAWRFLAPHTGWIAWSIADDVLFVFDGAVWRDLRELPVSLGSIDRVGINTSEDGFNRLNVRSNAVLLADIATGDGGSGDVRLQMSKEGAGNTASVVFSNAFSGRAEFGLIGSDAFKLKVSPDGSSFVEAFAIDQGSGNLALPRGLSLTGVISPAQITSDQNDYAPAGFAAASVVRISTDAARDITGLAGGSDGRKVVILNAGAFNAVLKDENASSAAAHRFGFGDDLTLTAKQGATLIYDAAASRWRMVGGPASSGGGSGTVTSIAIGAGLSGASSPITASGDIRLAVRGHIWGLTLANNATDATNDIDIAAGEAADNSSGALMSLGSTLTKRLDAGWAVGSGNGGLDTGSITNTTYHVWLIQRSDTGVVDALFSTSATTPAMPANYDRKRRIGSLTRAGAAIRAFTQNGDVFLLTSPVAVNTVTVNSTAVDLALAVPTGITIEALADVYGINSGAAAVWNVYSPFVSGGISLAQTNFVSPSSSVGNSATVRILTNNASIKAISNQASGGTVNHATLGWVDSRGR